MTAQRNEMEYAITKFQALNGDDKKSATETVNYLSVTSLKTQNWKLLSAVPTRGPMNVVLEAFRKETDIPLELPFFTMMHLLSGYLMQKNVRINSGIGEIGPEIWTIVLADSGSGKSFAHKTIAKNSPIQSLFPECASAAAFFEELGDEKNMLWFQDEFAQLLKEIENRGSPMAQIKSYLLRTYDNAPIERRTKKDGRKSIDKPRLGILALNTPESFLKSISMESMLDGFAQRFAIVRAECDPERHITDFPRYNVDRLSSAVADAWEAINGTEIHAKYSISEKAMKIFDENFKASFTEDIPKSFFRRIQFRNFKYSLLYHVLLGKNTSVIDEEDMQLAQRITTVHQEDMNRILMEKTEVKSMVSLVQKANQVRQRIEAKGKECTERDLLSGMTNQIKKKDEATTLIEIMKAKKAGERGHFLAPSEPHQVRAS